MSSDKLEIRYEGKEVVALVKWKVRVGQRIGQSGQQLFTYRLLGSNDEPIGDNIAYKCRKVGLIVDSMVKKEGDLVVPNEVVIQYKECLHNTVMKDLCADCGANINALDADQRRRIAELTSVSMVHSVPELRVSKERAETLGRADEQRLLKDRKLVLLVDLDQTLIHSTNHNIPSDEPDVHHFQLYGPHTQWYHTKFRPNTLPFLESMSKLFELHICTFGARRYAHTIANLMDPKELYFPKDRILSRDECFDPNLKTANMKSLFPCGDSMVCIIDDREDVWNFAPNLVTVKPYVCFRDTGDINAPEKAVGPQVDQSVDKTDELKDLTESTVVEVLDEKEQQIDANKPSVETPDVTENSLQNTTQTKPEEDVETTRETTDENSVEKVETKEEDSKSEEKVESKDSSTDSPKIIQMESELNSNSSSNEMIDENKDKKENKLATKSDSSVKPRESNEDTDDYLLYLEEILTRIHSEYYKEYDEKMKYKSESEEIKIPNLKEIIPNVRKKILNGINIVFSGVMPTNMPPEKHKLYAIAKSFGATISTDVVTDGSPKTTHLIAAKWGTVKVNKCVKAKNVWIIKPNWLYCCAERWERVDERLYLLDREMATTDRGKTSAKQILDTKMEMKRSSSGPKPESTIATTFATYDPKTGKRVRSQSQTQNPFLEQSPEMSVKSSGSDQNQQLLEQSRQIQPHNMLDFSPLSGFSINELQSMGKEVDDACSEGDAMSTGNTDSDSDVDIEDIESNNNNKKKKCDKRKVESSSDDSEDGEYPKGWNQNKKKKTIERKRVVEMEETNDSTRDWDDFESKPLNDCEEEESTDNQSIGSVDEEMALAVEREFLS
ncbi:unnamed protein product [Medioppia subpectinata]|uniref:RNA polymerase II subunit A C-terminal domain phosphatase n=1 Tax=Medioppia subpectinata TaxID=1979941 RepID=A0A7R9KM77_9ACAR|nr:unnamed protein product [Medioppia subpectinata]CAG2106097.1 unnamed protein product [Medioppia subpectinata]